MKIVFRVDASRLIGSGHIMRCLVLADALKEKNWSICFCCIATQGDLINLIEQKGYSVIKMPNAEQPNFELLDAKEFACRVGMTDWVVVDHYALHDKWEHHVKTKLSCKILSVDDLNRKHVSDIILDQNLYSNMQTRYAKSYAKKLLGPKYALLRKSFSSLRVNPPEKQNQLFAFFGGSDPTNECGKLLQAISTLFDLPFNIKIVTGRQNPNHEYLLKYKKIKNLTIVRNLDDFEFELAKSNYVIGASGVSNWERFCLNIPATIVCVADNQYELSQYLANHGYVHFLGDGRNTKTECYQRELSFLIYNWNNIVSLNQLDVDGLGVARVIKAIEGF